MDPRYYTRVSMAGWVFVAVVLIAVWDELGDAWQELTELFSSAGSPGVAVVALVAGVSAPPALGFLIERSLSALKDYINRLVYRLRGMKDPHGSRRLREIVADQVRDAGETFPPESTVSASTVKRVLYHSYAHDEYVHWSDRKASLGYATATSATAAAIGLIVAWQQFDSATLRVSVITLLVIGMLLFHTWEAIEVDHRVARGWVEIMGPVVARKYVDDLVGKRETDTRPAVEQSDEEEFLGANGTRWRITLEGPNRSKSRYRSDD